METIGWDYTALAQSYVSRPDYADAAIDQMIRTVGVHPGAQACDVGAGVAHLTLPLLRRGLRVTAIEPNAAMRALGVERTREFPNVAWRNGTAEQTGEPDRAFELVTFGSSFNVCDRPTSLRETARILRPNGWFACMWNHRDLDDPLQRAIESVIHSRIPGYTYGNRREDQTSVITDSGLFESVTYIEARVTHRLSKGRFVDAWRSHATLQRQAGEAFQDIVRAIEALALGLPDASVSVPYQTRVWVARRI